MLYVSEIQIKTPCHFQIQFKEKIEKLQISFLSVVRYKAITMEDCVVIDEKLNTIKTLSVVEV